MGARVEARDRLTPRFSLHVAALDAEPDLGNLYRERGELARQARTRTRVARAFDHFADVSELPVAAIVERIRADRIAFLINLNGYTEHSREQIFALRPAPVQIASRPSNAILPASRPPISSSIRFRTARTRGERCAARRRAAHPLLDTARFTRDLEDALVRAWAEVSAR